MDVAGADVDGREVVDRATCLFGGLLVAVQSDDGACGTNSYWLRLEAGRIAVRELPGEILAGVGSSGVHYLDLPHVDTRLAIRSFDDDQNPRELRG